MVKLDDLKRFYDLMCLLEKNVGKKRLLKDCNGRMDWPQRGVYFFFEPGEVRRQSGEGPKVVRVGTHALIKGVRATLWNRLQAHKGFERDGGGNHRGSIFRLHVGSALIQKDNWAGEIQKTWGIGQNAPKEIRQVEKTLEQAVSLYIREMPFLWLEVDDAPGPDSLRGVIEKNSIALLSNYNSSKDPIDPPGKKWLGHLAKNELIRKSGLWNVNHVEGGYDPAFLDLLEPLILDYKPMSIHKGKA